VVAALTAPAAAPAPLSALGGGQGWIALVLVATFLGGIANLVAIVALMVSATSGLPDREQGLATGLATMSQQVGITLGIPVMSAIVATREPLLDAITLAIAVNAGIALSAALFVLRTIPDRNGP
jgi:predicted MFS family arabinose efflux permease